MMANPAPPPPPTRDENAPPPPRDYGRLKLRTFDSADDSGPATPGRARAWINPQFPDVTGASVPPADERAPPVPMPPRIDVTGVQAGAGAASLVATGGAFRVDYVSILPPELYSM